MKPDLPDKPVSRGVHKYFDGDRMVVRISPTKQHVFLDRRCAVTWPTPHNAGYFAAYGLLDEAKLPVVMLSEHTFKNLDVMIDSIFIKAMDYGASAIYGDLGDDYGMVRKKVAIKSQKLTSQAPGLYDSSEWTDMERSVPILHELNRDLALVLPEGTMINREYSTLRPDSLKMVDRIQPWQRFPAFNALAQCVLGWELFPYRKKRRDDWAMLQTGGKEGY